MSPADAARILDLPADASLEQLEARFLDLRRKLEDKIAKAPTPGLQAKYRESLAAITVAFETLTLAADSSSLPVLAVATKQTVPNVGSSLVDGPAAPRAASSPHSGNPKLKTKNQKSGKEFLIVALIAIALLSAGAWFVLKTRAENDEKARVMAERTAETERKAEAARLAAETKRKADEEERTRLATAEKAEQARKQALTAQLRTALAEARIIWESIAKEERTAERALNDFRSEARSIQREGPAAKYNELVARAAATQRYLAWLVPHLERHPAQIARAKIEELLSAQAPDEAQELMGGLQAGLATLQQEVAAQKTLLDRLEGYLQVNSVPSGLEFELVDGFGLRFSGRTPVHLKTNPGPAVITARRPGYQNVSVTTPVEMGQTAQALVEVVSETVTISTEPDVEILSNNRLLARGQFVMVDHPPGVEYAIELRRAGFRSFHMKVPIQQGKSARTLAYNFTAMSAQKHVCSDCNHGRREEYRDCSSCNGEGGHRCRQCGGRGNFGIVNGVVLDCFSCRGGQVKCTACNGDGGRDVSFPCATCGGDGRLSDIDLAAR